MKKTTAGPIKTNKTVITAALPYANGPIHIGHLLEYIQADIYSRFLKLTEHDALYICASDMHGTPIEINAQKAGQKPEAFVEKYWLEHQADFKSFLIQFDNYYKTHSPENKELAELFYSTLKKKGLIYRKTIQVMYCDHCKRSLPDRYVKGTCPHCQAADQYGDVCEKCGSVLKSVDLINPYCIICNQKPRLKDSEHYFFKLSTFTKELRRWFDSPASHIQPEVRNWLESWFEKGLDDWCVSRDAPYFGFEIPDSKKETGEIKYFYVWLDAPIGYISSTKNYCDNHKQDWKDYWYNGQVQHFIGKDIAYFHLLFWPAMLIGMGIPLPQVNIHGFITVNGEKMSKSRGTFLTAKDFLQLYTPEALRFYYASHLDRKVVDVDLSFSELKAVVNSVLLGNIGNFCYRSLVFTEKNYGAVKEIAAEPELKEKINSLFQSIEYSYSTFDFKSAVRDILQIADLANAYFQKAEPWKTKESAETKAAIGFCINLARDLAILVSPILPEFSPKIYTALGGKNLLWKDLSFEWKGKVGKVDVLVTKIEDKEEVNKANEVKKEKINGKKVTTTDNKFPLHLAVGLVEEVKDHPNADSLYLLTVNFASLGVKQVVTSLKKILPTTAFLKKKLVFCVNLKPSKFRGEVSEAMILGVDHDDTTTLFEMPKSSPGDSVVPQGMTANQQQISFDDFSKVELVVQTKNIVFAGKALGSSVEKIIVKNVKDGVKVH